MASIDLSTYTDEDLGMLSREISSEQDRRRSLAAIPGKISELRDQFIECGGDPADLG